MALSNPLGKGDFVDLLSIAEAKFVLQWSQEKSVVPGDTLYADRGPARWMAEISTVPMTHADAEGLMALINSRGGGLRTALIYNPKMMYPTSDPSGATFGAATPVVGTIADRSNVAFTGFPFGYGIPRGTFFQIVFDTSRYYLGQFAEAKTASGAGAVTTVAVTPPLPAGITSGDAVTVIKPAAKFRITPDSAYPDQVDTIYSRVSFAAEQSYAA